MNTLIQFVQHMDARAHHFLAHFAGNHTLDLLASKMDGNHLPRGGIIFATYWYLWFRRGPDRENRRTAIVTIVTGTILALLAERAIALTLPFRVRPMYNPALEHPSYSLDVSPNLEEWSSFPSGHATYFFSLAFGLAYLLRPLSIPILLYTAVWICLPRMYFGVHYASDIIAGAVVGIAVVWACLRTGWLRSAFAGRVLQFMKSSPGWFYWFAFLICFEMSFVFDDVRRVGRKLFHLLGTVSHQGFLHAQRAAIWLIPVLITVSVLCLLYRRHRHHPAVGRGSRLSHT